MIVAETPMQASSQGHASPYRSPENLEQSIIIGQRHCNIWHANDTDKVTGLVVPDCQPLSRMSAAIRDSTGTERPYAAADLGFEAFPSMPRLATPSRMAANLKKVKIR